MLNWSLWGGMDINDTWSIAYEFRQKQFISEKTALIGLFVVFIVTLIMIWFNRKKLTTSARNK